MSLLFRIVYAAHARGTHHKLALDALRHLSGPDAEPWQRLFLKYADVYMEGAKAPDDSFKDFKNHVLHVGDGYWGGAPEKVESWYVKLVEMLAAESWSQAVYCAGILSHYYTDPIHPFHTGQTEAENNIHRAVEWSISKSYAELKEIGETLPAEAEPRLGSGSGWLRELVIQSAEVSNRHYEKLIAHYDINRGVVDPPAGLDDVSRRIVGALIVYAYRSFALVLDRAFREAAIAPPEVSLTLETIMAAVKIPLKALQKKLADGEDRRQVERMYDELKATGRVEVNLPEDDRMVRDLYRVEVLARREHELQIARSARLVTTRADVVAKRPGRVIPPPAAAAGTLTTVQSGTTAQSVDGRRPVLRSPSRAAAASARGARPESCRKSRAMAHCPSAWRRLRLPRATAALCDLPPAYGWRQVSKRSFSRRVRRLHRRCGPRSTFRRIRAFDRWQRQRKRPHPFLPSGPRQRASPP